MSDTIIVCLECGAADACHENTVRVDSVDDVVQCDCGKYSILYDMMKCESCKKSICIRCQWEGGYKCYCETCAEICANCGQLTNYYKGIPFACRRCGYVTCADCMDDENICPDCADAETSN